jgi:hypothetical protein
MEELIRWLLDVTVLRLAEGLDLTDPGVFLVAVVIVVLCGGGGGAAVPIAAVVATVMSDGTVKVKGKQD